MHILHLLSQNHLTGAEVYAVTLGHQQIQLGHAVYQISNGFYFQSQALQTPLEVETKSFATFLKNIFWLRNYIQSQKIHVIHTHSRAAAKLAYWATLWTKTAQVSTVHGVQHASFSKKLHNQYGQFIIAVCENIKDHLCLDFSYNEKFIKVLRNPVNPSQFYFIPKNSAETKSLKKLAIIGRTTGPKKERTEQVLKTLAHMNIEITLIGGELQNLNISDDYKSKIKLIPHLELTSAVYAKYDVIIGSGRVCIESILTGVPTIAFGEARFIGLITEKNFQEALKSNFGDIDLKSKTPKVDERKLIEDVEIACNNNQFLPLSLPLQNLSKLCEAYFSLDSISQKILRIYESAYFLKNHPKWIPILMYHKIPAAEIKSQHKIYVTKNNFEKHLQFFKKQGFQTLTFADLEHYRQGQKDFRHFPKKPLILTFDDGYKDNLENASPLLKKYNFKAQLFLLADPQINQNIWDKSDTEPAHEIIAGSERLQWKNSAFEIGSHGFSHQKITSLNDTEALNELVNSKKCLEKEFGTNVNVYAFTYGSSSKKAAELAEKAGYGYAVNTDSGGLNIEEAPYSIFRVNIFPNETRWSLFKKTSTWYRRYYFFKRKK